jgi:PAS domain-containing protein
MVDSRRFQENPSRSGTNLIFGSGEIAEIIRAFDWSTTSLGSIENWSDALLITVNTVLGNRQPNFLFWGDDLFQFYNDAFRPSLGFDKHPKAIGQRGPECWSEIWPMIGPQIDAVMQRGESCWFEDQLVPFYRDGKIEDIYWTYSYSPVRDAAGNIRGTLVTCSETTGRVKVERALRTEQERLLSLFHQAPAFLSVLRGPEHVFEMHNLRYTELIGPARCNRQNRKRGGARSCFARFSGNARRCL